MTLFVDENDPSLPLDVIAKTEAERLVYVQYNNATYKFLLRSGYVEPDITTESDIKARDILGRFNADGISTYWDALL